jgi:transcriptional regulator with XRE-family HTH domain
MHTVSAQQVKAARALLNWKQEDLAAASCMSLSAIRSFEIGYAPRISTTIAICKAIENAGIEFIEDDGVKRSNPEIKLYRGSDSCDEFFDNVFRTVKKQDSEVIVFVKEHEALTQSCGVPRRTNLERLETISNEVTVKCLVLDVLTTPLCSSAIEFRLSSQQIIGPSSVLVYGNKYATIIPEGRQDFIIHVFSIVTVTLGYREQFLSLWDASMPILTRTEDLRMARTAG